MCRHLVRVFPWVGLTLSVVCSGESTDLFLSDKENFGWRFDNGQEFPGATGRLGVDKDVAWEGRASLRLDGDFTKGGNYVQAMATVPEVDIENLSFRLKCSTAKAITFRIVDSGGRCHQVVWEVHPTDQWQLVEFPLSRFFERMGTTQAVRGVVRYESWGGSTGDKWHGPAKSLCVLLGRPSVDAETKTGTLWLNDVRVTPRTAEAATDVKMTVRLDELLTEDEMDWRLNLGWEFPGAKATLVTVKDQPRQGLFGLKLSGDFTQGGAYVAAEKSLASLDVKSVERVRLQLFSENVTGFTIRLVDGTDQCHQKKGNVLAPDGKWHELVIQPADTAGGEHWGGANDGKWHDPLKLLSIIVGSNASPQDKRPVLILGDVAADVVIPAVVKPAAFYEGFETGGTLPIGWETKGNVAVGVGASFKGKAALRLERPEKQIEEVTTAASPRFLAAPGTWEIGGALRAELRSPDNSYNGAVHIESLDAAGRAAERFEIATAFGTTEWQAFKKRVEIPPGTASARLHISLNKASGVVCADELSASCLAAASPVEKRIDRVLISSDRLGNLFFPEDKPAMQMTVEAFRPLPPGERNVSFVVRDYWGMGQCPQGQVVLEKGDKSAAGRFLYKASLDLGDRALEVGKYYELHVAIPQAGAEPRRDSTSFARLPVAETRNYKPEEIPFTSRNWDNRIREYFFLSDRLGIRVCGVWGGWSAAPPYDTHAPGIPWCKELGMGWLSGTPAALIESHGKGYKDYDEEALREGARRFVQQYRKAGLMMLVLGNEPHGDIERARENVAAYQAIYEEVKKTDPSVFVVGTSVGPEENYFKAGFQESLDAYNFHVYADYRSVPEAFRQYEKLFEKYGGRKPIYSTELGLNSQGMTRLAVAKDLIKKVTLFFASGGVNCSWFTIMYPDPNGNARGTFGDAHCVFDCRYNLYSPRLDALAYYSMVNGICVKEFLSQKEYDPGIRTFLLGDASRRCLLVIWKEEGRKDVFLPLAGVGEVRVVRIDGSRTTLDAARQGLTLSISDEPILLLYESKSPGLPDTLGAARVSLSAPVAPTGQGGRTRLNLRGPGISPERLRVVAPPAWTATCATAEDGTVGCALAAPADEAASEGRIVIRLNPPPGEPGGELFLSVPPASPD